MQKPHLTCYDMECDECPERDSCSASEEAGEATGTEVPTSAELAAAFEVLAVKFAKLVGEVEALTDTVNGVRERYDDIVAAVVRAANRTSDEER